MDRNYVFMTDSDSDLPFHLKEQYNIPVVYMPYALDGKEYFDDLGQMVNHKSYYDMMRNGAVPVTSALNEEAYLQAELHYSGRVQRPGKAAEKVSGPEIHRGGHAAHLRADDAAGPQGARDVPRRQAHG